ncbi:MAG: DUF11 domain-containing protein [Lewinellaceae bacterium]|nr:DUF11 domain-containing protein [Saprospiraceae bacterium]MCB9339037.1 DUF11 domain-containing protein [Lewinellaceae bacterium]
MNKLYYLPNRLSALLVLLLICAALANPLFSQNVCTTRTATNTVANCGSGYSYGFFANGLVSGISANNHYSISNGVWTEYSDGTAVYTAKATNVTNSNVKFNINVQLSGRVFSAPAGSPKTSTCYTINPSQWYYYTQMSGTLTGQNSLAGGVIQVSLLNNIAFQVGVGANLMDANKMGGSSWLSYTIVSHPTASGVSFLGNKQMDINVRLSGSQGVGCPEICGNGIDDDGDGAVDSNDPDCFSCPSGLLSNPSFSSSLTSWDNWGNTSIQTEANGNKYARVSGGQGGFGQYLAATAGTTYTVSFLGKKTGAEYSSSGIVFYDASWNQIGSNYTVQVLSSNFQQYSFTYTAPANTAYVGIFGWKNAGTGTLDLDGFCVTTATPPSEICGNGVDDDGDGAIDSNDPDCFSCTSGLLSNPSFSSGLTSWDDWGYTSIQTEANGNKFARVSGGAGGFGQNLAATAGTTYTLSFLGKNTSAQDSWAGFSFYDASWTKIGSDHSLQVNSSNFKQYSVSYTAPANTAYLIVFGWKNAGTSLDLDGFCLQSGSPCANQGGDSDGDGVCNNVDCQPNNSAYPAAPGTPCNDGNANTTNDVVTANGCGCAGITSPCNTYAIRTYKVSDVSQVCLGLTNENGVFYRRDDCNDVHVVYHAGNNLYFTEYQNGTAILSGNITKGSTTGQVNIVFTGLTNGMGNTWTDNCYLGGLGNNMKNYQSYSGTIVIGGVSYTVTPRDGSNFTLGSGASMQSGQYGFGAWSGGTFGGCTEFFGNLTIVNPNSLPPGTACNDGNANTNNDVIQADGCTCAGTPTQIDLELTKSASASTVTSGQSVAWTISVVNKGPAAAMGVTVKDAFPSGLTYNSATASQGSFNAGTLTWNIGNLAVNQTVTLTINTTVTATSGTIRNFAQVQTASPNDVDSTPGNDTNQTVNEDDEDDATINVQPNNPCANQGGDSDGDGVCNNVDCQPNNPAFPATPGTACNDGNPNTTNDVVQADGCSCAGTPTGGNPNCETDITITTGNGTITVTGLNGAPVSSLQIFTATWQSVYSCFANCGASQTVNVPVGTYLVYAKYYTAGYSIICEKQATVTVGGGTCDNITSGGTIGFGTNCASSSSFCPSQGAAPTVKNCIAPSGGAGNLEIVWLKSTTSCTAPTTTAAQIAAGLDPHWTMIPGATSLDYSPTNVTQQTCFLRCSRRAGCPNFVESNIVTLGISSNCGGGSGNPDCANINISTGPGSIVIAGLDGAPVTSVQIFSATWQPEHNCFANCQSPTATFSVTAGAHIVYVKYYTAGYQLICEVNQTVNVVQALAGSQAENFQFEAAKFPEHVELLWLHKGDYKVDEYILERSADGQDFEEIYAVASEKDALADLYQGYDIEPLTGMNHYRVKMLNEDGTVSFSEVKMVEYEDLIDFVLFPNPANQFTNINLESIVGFKDVDIHVYNNMGVRMKHFHLDEVWSKYYQMDLRELHEGHYSVWVNIPGRRPRTVQLVIGRL